MHFQSIFCTESCTINYGFDFDGSDRGVTKITRFEIDLNYAAASTQPIVIEHILNVADIQEKTLTIRNIITGVTFLSAQLSVFGFDDKQ